MAGAGASWCPGCQQARRHRQAGHRCPGGTVRSPRSQTWPPRCWGPRGRAPKKAGREAGWLVNEQSVRSAQQARGQQRPQTVLMSGIWHHIYTPLKLVVPAAPVPGWPPAISATHPPHLEVAPRIVELLPLGAAPRCCPVDVRQFQRAQRFPYHLQKWAGGRGRMVSRGLASLPYLCGIAQLAIGRMPSQSHHSHVAGAGSTARSPKPRP